MSGSEPMQPTYTPHSIDFLSKTGIFFLESKHVYDGMTHDICYAHVVHIKMS